MNKLEKTAKRARELGAVEVTKGDSYVWIINDVVYDDPEELLEDSDYTWDEELEEWV